MAEGESKSYNPAEHEGEIFAQWERDGVFHPQPDERGREDRFSIVIPPPNVTGALHLGHALNNTLQDILIRRKRMQGANTLWLVGTDHAGIATQATVEKTIRKEEGKSRHDLGREELVRRIWEWKEKFGGRIVEQLRLMGCSCDYERERFTLDEGCAKAVRQTFFKLFRDGLIYRGKRLVNWDTQLQTAVADDEVYHETVKGHFYHFKYPIKDAQAGEPEFVHIATTRPETMLADTAVAVHPKPDVAFDRVEAELKQKLAEAPEKDKAQVQASLDDIAERRKTHLPTLLKLRDMAKARRKVALPLVNREIPLVCDEWAKPELGSGCVKITPAHDPNDYEVAQRHGLPMINILTGDGKIARIVEANGAVNAHSEKYEGLRFSTKGREQVVADLEARGLVEKIEDRMIEIGHSDRSKAQIEPYLSDQWFVKMGDLTEEEAARVGSPFLKAYIERSRSEQNQQSEPSAQSKQCAPSEPRPSGSGQCSNDRCTDSRRLPGLAQLAIDALESGDFKFHPSRYAKTYLDWLGEKRDWCISRQLWWGHRIPVWTKKAPVPDEFRHLAEAMADDTQLIEWTGFTIRPEWREYVAVQSRFTKVDSPPGSYIGESHVCFQPNHPEIELELIEQGFAQDPDVLDTWFSSALWPHSTLGWPGSGEALDGERRPLPDGRGSDGTAGETEVSRDGSTGETPVPQDGPALQATDDEGLLDYFYPTNVLSTAREIITLWVARMVMTGLYNVGEVPFSDVVIHPVIQDGQGRKMSKSLGNGVDPVDIIDEYGADALRFTLADLATETQDIRMPVQKKKLPDGRTINISPKFEKGRNFCNKLWQASTGFVMGNLEGYAPRPLDPAALGLEDRWILSRLTACVEGVDRALEAYRFSEAMERAYHFMWDEYCSWYIEMSKPRLDGDARAETQQVLVHVLDQLLRLLHPLVPFVTEAIWRRLNEAAPDRGLGDIARREPALVTASWPAADLALRDERIESQMGLLHTVIRSMREIRTTVNGYRGRQKQPTLRSLPRVVILADAEASGLLEVNREFVALLAHCDLLEVGADVAKPAASLSRIHGSVQVYVPVGELVDLAEVRAAEEKALIEHRGALERTQRQLANADFVARANPEVVEQARTRAAEYERQIALVEQHLGDLG